jgi:hypothetical protein
MWLYHVQRKGDDKRRQTSWNCKPTGAKESERQGDAVRTILRPVQALSIEPGKTRRIRRKYPCICTFQKHALYYGNVSSNENQGRVEDVSTRTPRKKKVAGYIACDLSYLKAKVTFRLNDPV